MIVPIISFVENKSQEPIPYEFSSVCRFSSPKQDRNSYHLLRDARNLPCGNIACYNCIIDAIKNNKEGVKCDFKYEYGHSIECTAIHEIRLEDADKLQPTKEFGEVISKNCGEIGVFILENMKKHLQPGIICILL
jgi:hypothetical protein